MNLWNCLFVIILAVAVQSEDASLLKPCLMKDIECLSQATEQFLENTCRGIPEYDIRAIDPLIIPSLEFEVDEDMGLRFSFKNLNVTGLRGQKISEFQMNTDTKKVVLKTKANLHIIGDLTIELTKDSKQFSGIYNADSTVLGTARYNYDLKTDEKGVEHFEVGPETIECASVTEPTVSLDANLQTVLDNDPVAKARMPEYMANVISFRKKAICKIAEQGYINVVHNIRASAKILPKSAFFKDV